MNNNLEKLYKLALKPERRIVGLMSGTSFDGLDVALCKVRGSGLETSIELEKFETVTYTDGFKKELKSIFSRRDADLEKVCLMNEWIGIQHGKMINQCLKKWEFSKENIDLIASHGQTIYHAPKFYMRIKNFRMPHYRSATAIILP
jgi:anhydro-N-acetylmuramic acid kinase